MISSTITGVALLPLNLTMRNAFAPLDGKPPTGFVTALGGKRLSHNLLVAIRLKSGVTGFGEASESLAWAADTQGAMTNALRPMTAKLLGSSIRQVRRHIALGWEAASRHATAAAALECALWDAFARWKGISLWRWCGGARRFVTTGLTLSAWPHEQAARVARKAYLRGFRTFKIKITGHHPEEDIRRVISVHRAAPRAWLWIDANQGLRAQEAIRFSLFARQHKFPVRLFEQPVSKGDWEGLRQVEQEGGIPVAADESARTVEEVKQLIRRKIVSVINVKLAKCGLSGGLKIIRMANKAGVDLMIGCMAESALGLTHSVHLACGTGAFRFVDLDSHLLTISPKGTPGFRTHGARLLVSARPGSGVELS